MFWQGYRTDAEAKSRRLDAELEEKVKAAEARAMSLLEVELARLRAEKESALEEARRAAAQQV